MRKTHLLVIDPQWDFCDPKGALCVAGADRDMERLAKFIDKYQTSITSISVTMDSHHLLDIAHPMFWRDANGKQPGPFTIISPDDIKTGKWRAARKEWEARAETYVQTLAKNGRYPLCVWPPHCLIGSPGHAIYPCLYEALNRWCTHWLRTVNVVTKGSNPWTEHYSAVLADVPDPKDPTTQINAGLISQLENSDEVLLTGEAGSHCLANTVRDIVANFQDSGCVKKLTLLTDATSPVTGFEGLQDAFIKDMSKVGMRTSTTVAWTSK
jgi:nicotinamidase/pyrazinamidase